ncbi:MAG: DUF6551 family protein, partial [Hyphomicrobium sp.]
MREHDHDQNSFRPVVPEARIQHVMPEACRQLKPVKAINGTTPAARLGERAELCLLPLDRLVIDERYQRPVTEKGRANISRILARFDWRKFAPIVVVSVGGGYYAIIDGQHRATAALMHPDIDMVPCMVVQATLAEAAETFAAINGQVTGVTVGQVFRARLASGDPAAAAVAGQEARVRREACVELRFERRHELGRQSLAPRTVVDRVGKLVMAERARGVQEDVEHARIGGLHLLDELGAAAPRARV